MVRWINYKGKLCFDRCLAIRQSRNLIEKPSQRRSKICCFMRIFGRSFWSELPVSSQHSFSDKWKILLQKQRRELGLKRFWSAVKTSNSSSSQGDYESPPDDTRLAPNCSLPLLQVGSCYCSVARSVTKYKNTMLQVWPSSDSPRGEADGQSFVFPECVDNVSQHSICVDNIYHTDSGIESTQVSYFKEISGNFNLERQRYHTFLRSRCL